MACTCDQCPVHDRDPEMDVWGYGSEEAFVVHMPGRKSGAATIGHRRITTEMVADYYWNMGFDELQDGYDLTVGEVVTAVWFEARYGTRTRRKRWKEWLEANEMKLWSPSMYGRPDIPTTKAAIQGREQ